MDAATAIAGAINGAAFTAPDRTAPSTLGSTPPVGDDVAT
jgi:hypothetical protein